jgi:hypothetical protein
MSIACGEFANVRRLQEAGHDVGELALHLQALFPGLNDVRVGKRSPERMAMHHHTHSVDERLSLDKPTQCVVTDASLVRSIIGDVPLEGAGVKIVCL